MKFPACIFFPGILATSEWLDQQPDLALSPSSGGPCAVTLGCSLLLLPPGHSPGGVRREQSPAWESSLPPVLPCWKAGKGWSRTAVPSWHHSIPLSPGGHKYTAFSYLLMCKFSIKAWHSCGLLRNIRFQTHSEVKYPCDAIPECIMLHFKVF